MKRLTALLFALVLLICPVFAQKNAETRVKTIVIDPGHGGDKPGAIGHKIAEKDLVLQVSKKFGKLVADNFPDVHIIYTRTSDVDITLAERAHIANRNHADLFISIHANSHHTSQPTGVETFVMGLSSGKANLEVAKTENADILKEKDYKNNSDYQGFDPNSPESYVMFSMFQNAYLTKSLNFAQFTQNQYKKNLSTIDRGVKQAELFVLYKTTCPSVLTEIGFISNPTEENFMISEEGQAKIAVSLFNAFAAYKAQEDGTKPISNPKIDILGWGKNKSAEPATADTTAVDVPVATPEHATADSVATLPNYDPQFEDSDPDANRPHLLYKVQFYSSDQLLSDDAKEFKEMPGVEHYKQGNRYCYTRGRCKSVRDAVVIQYEVRRTGFKDAFVVAFLDGKRISLQEAKEIEEDYQNANK